MAGPKPAALPLGDTPTRNNLIQRTNKNANYTIILLKSQIKKL